MFTACVSSICGGLPAPGPFSKHLSSSQSAAFSEPFVSRSSRVCTAFGISMEQESLPDSKCFSILESSMISLVELWLMPNSLAMWEIGLPWALARITSVLMTEGILHLRGLLGMGCWSRVAVIGSNRVAGAFLEGCWLTKQEFKPQGWQMQEVFLC
jgi:hypothetical protein